MTYGTRYLKGTRILNTRAPNPHSATYTAIFEISKIAKWASAMLTTKYKPQDDPIKLPMPMFLPLNVILSSSHHIPMPRFLHL